MRKTRAAEFRRAAQLGAQDAADSQALAMAAVYDLWQPGKAYGGEGQPRIVRRPSGRLYRCQSPHTSQAGWEPETARALWTVIAGGEAGTEEDPIPAARGMEYEYGLYYLDPEDDKVYLCERTGEAAGGKVVLQYLPHELIGHYFTAAQA